MRTSIAGIASTLSLFIATPAFAQDAEAPEEDSSITVSGGATLVSDYRYRGISQTDKDFAVQGSLTISHDSGLYVGLWGSSIDDYVAAGADQEIDIIAGFKKEVSSGLTLDVGATYYYYPGAEKIIPNYNSDFIEGYAALSGTIGPVTAKGTVFYAPKQNALSVGSGKEDNLYLRTDLSAAIPNTPVSLTGSFGYSFGPSYLTIGDEYADWSLGASYTDKNLTFGVSYVDTNKALLSPISGKNISKGGVVASFGVVF
jgi:uncharacterized protein (TIGR02001 family)